LYPTAEQTKPRRQQQCQDVATKVAEMLNAMKAGGSFDKPFDSYHCCTTAIRI
jgi:hypothetical protein